MRAACSAHVFLLTCVGGGGGCQGVRADGGVSCGSDRDGMTAAVVAEQVKLLLLLLLPT